MCFYFLPEYWRFPRRAITAVFHPRLFLRNLCQQNQSVTRQLINNTRFQRALKLADQIRLRTIQFACSL